MKRAAKRRKSKEKRLFILLFIAILCVVAGKIPHASFTVPFHSNTIHHIASEDNGWNLILVNRDNYIPADYKVQLTELSNGKKVDSRIYPELQEMFDDARAQGYSLFVREGYRTQEEQQQLMDEKIEAYENDGKSKSEAKKLAEQWVAIPGTSEHQLGIAVDINADTTKSSSDDVYNWLAENAHTYGFIKRYPSNKTDITGVINEPWHYRYVGKEAASKIYSQGICLEEYIDTLGYADSGHIETVCLLSKLHEAERRQATYEEIKKYVAEYNDGMKVSNLYIAQVKRKCGIELAENFNIPRSEGAKQPQCPKEKEEAIIGALKAFQMI